MSKRIRVQTFGFMQYLDEEYWNWSDAEKQQFFTDSDTILRRICSRIHTGLQQAGETGEDLKFEFAGINHNKDTDLIWDSRQQIEVIEPIKEHVHGVVTLSKKRDLNVVAQWLGVEPEYIDVPKGRYGKENMLAYLIHAKDPAKYQYDPGEVRTFGTFDYIAYWEGKKPAWDRHKATVQTKNNKISAHWLVKQVQQGLIGKRDIMRNDTYKEIYADNMPLINDAIQFYGEMKGFETLEALENGEFELSVFFITGAPGSGKTHFALDQIRRWEKEMGWRSYQASPTNPMDDYNGEEVVLLDDLRAGTLDATAWLQMLDARTSANMGARYKNKRKAYRALVITSYLEPYEFFSYVKGTGGANEALDQFIRRIMLNIRIHRMDDSGRFVEIEAIGKTPHPVLYDLREKKFIAPDETVQTYENGLPMQPDGYGYSERQLAVAKHQMELKLVNHAGYPVYKNDGDSASDFLASAIRNKNNPDMDYSKTERPNIGNQMAFINENPELAKALKIGEHAQSDGE